MSSEYVGRFTRNGLGLGLYTGLSISQTTMPLGALDFRAVCGCFMPVYNNLMVKRSKLKAAMKLAIVILKPRVDGVTLGLLLSYLFWGNLLLQCGDVEQNPGPTDNMRQTRLTSGSRAATTERAVGSQDTPPNTATPRFSGHPSKCSYPYQAAYSLRCNGHATEHEQLYDQNEQ